MPCHFPMISSFGKGRWVKSRAAFVHERLWDDRGWLLPHIVMAEFQHSHLQNLITVPFQYAMPAAMALHTDHVWYKKGTRRCLCFSKLTTLTCIELEACRGMDPSTLRSRNSLRGWMLVAGTEERTERKCLWCKLSIGIFINGDDRELCTTKALSPPYCSRWFPLSTYVMDHGNASCRGQWSSSRWLKCDLTL